MIQLVNPVPTCERLELDLLEVKHVLPVAESDLVLPVGQPVALQVALLVDVHLRTEARTTTVTPVDCNHLYRCRVNKFARTHTFASMWAQTQMETYSGDESSYSDMLSYNGLRITQDGNINIVSL